MLRWYLDIFPTFLVIYLKSKPNSCITYLDIEDFRKY